MLRSLLKYRWRIQIPRHNARGLLLLPAIGYAIYAYSEEQKYVFNEKLEERDSSFKANASQLLAGQNFDMGKMTDVCSDSDDNVVDRSFFHDSFTVVFMGDIQSFKEIQTAIEARMASYNLRYLLLVSEEYRLTNESFLRGYKAMNAKKDDLMIARDTSNSVEPKTVYCILNDKLIFMEPYTPNGLEQIAKTMSLKINKELEKLFVQQIDF